MKRTVACERYMQSEVNKLTTFLNWQKLTWNHTSFYMEAF